MSDNITQEEKFASVFTHPNDQNGGINEGKKYDPTDCLYAEDVNKIVQNEVFLYEKNKLYRHRLTFDCNGNGVAHYEFINRNSSTISFSYLASELGMISGGNIAASGFVYKNSVLYIVTDINIGSNGTLTANGLKIDGSVFGSMDISTYTESSGVTFTDTVTEVEYVA